ncbi:MAG: glycine oxidase ThiO [Actinobacteria bacterium]|nr:glycine oxidase ThiO [Actinomycetota bacterium]
MDVVIVGGGAIGLSIAWRSKERGLDVAVIDESFGHGASWAAAGMLAPVTEVHYGEEAVLQINLESSRRYPRFAADLTAASGRDVGYRQSGTLIVAPDGDDFAALNELFAFQCRLGLDARALKPSEARSLEPALAPSIRGAFFVEGDHHVDNRLLVGALEEACRRTGVELIEDRVEEMVTTGDRVTGVRLGDGRSMEARTVVLAAGSWSGRIAGIPERARPPVRPVKGQLLYLKGSESSPLLSRNVRGLDVYIVPRADGRIAVGATVEEKEFDTTVTADAVYTLLRDAYELIPGLRELELLEMVVGFRPGSPDNAPMLGPSTVDGLVIATGHYRNGILLAPVTADEIAHLLATGETSATIAPFTPTRFSATGVAS